MNKIKLESRYKDVENYYNPIDAFNGYVTTTGDYTRVIYDDSQYKTIHAIDFEGGPMLSIGDTIGDKKIKAIKNVYQIELE